jgi:hypothetical protein
VSENDAVRLTVFVWAPNDAPSFAEGVAVVDDRRIVRQVDTTTPRLLTAAGAVVREFVPPDRMEQLLTALEKAFAAVPISGFAAVVNVPTRLAFVAVWSWAQGAGQLGPEVACTDDRTRVHIRLTEISRPVPSST